MRPHARAHLDSRRHHGIVDVFLVAVLSEDAIKVVVLGRRILDATGQRHLRRARVHGRGNRVLRTANRECTIANACKCELWRCTLALHSSQHDPHSGCEKSTGREKTPRIGPSALPNLNSAGQYGRTAALCTQFHHTTRKAATPAPRTPRNNKSGKLVGGAGRHRTAAVPRSCDCSHATGKVSHLALDLLAGERTCAHKDANALWCNCRLSSVGLAQWALKRRQHEAPLAFQTNLRQRFF